MSCTGPGGSPGLAYAFRLSVRGKRGASVTTTLRFARPRFASLAALVAAAPLPPLAGQEVQWNDLDFVIPQGWGRTDYTNAVKLSGVDGTDACDVFVFAPVVPDASNGLTSQLLQLHDMVESLYGSTIYGELGQDDPYATYITATTGLGQPAVGLIATGPDRSTEIQATMTQFASDFAVPIVRVGGSCMRGWRFDAEAAEIEVTMSRASGSAESLTAYAQPILGEWTAGSGSAGALYAYAANGHYTWAFSKNGIVQVGATLFDVYLNWAGDGNYVVMGPVVAHFPVASTTGAASEIASMWTEHRSGVPAITWLCSLVDLGKLDRVCVGRN